MQTSQADWKAFFQGANAMLDATQNVDRLLRLRLGSGFNVFDFIQPDENKLSDILKDFLNPKGNHGQGSVFIRLALEHLIPTPDSITDEQIEKCIVAREVPTFNGRRLDLIITLGPNAIAIENKPFAPELDNQLSDYAKHLQLRFGERFSLVFLHGKGGQAISLSGADRNLHRQRGRFLEVPYYASDRPSLHSWLVRCANISQSEKIRMFLQDFAGYVADTFTSPEEGSA